MINKSRVFPIVLLFSVVIVEVVEGLPFLTHRLDRCYCDEEEWSLGSMMRCQLISDFLIALSYFSIPLELLYFISCTNSFPFWWVVAQFGAFIVLCGLTHFVAIWTYVPHHSFNLILLQTILKVLTALVSCATAISLVHIIPELLGVKIREIFLQNKAEELNREVHIRKREEERGRHVRMLTNEIRNSIERHAILATTLEELGEALDLDNCTIWMPNAEGTSLELTHERKRRTIQAPISISSDDGIVQAVQASSKAVDVPSTCMLGIASSHGIMTGPMVGVRLPLLRASNFKGGTPESLQTSYAIMILALSSADGDREREWASSELEIVEVVADQVAVALSHAALLEESYRIQDQLTEQNKALLQARLDAETAIKAKDNFMTAINHEMRKPLHVISALSSLLQESDLSSEQSIAMVVAGLTKSSSLLTALLNDVLDYSRLEDSLVALELNPFQLLNALKEAATIVIPMAKRKKINVSYEFDTNLPCYVIGDEKRLLQVIISLMGNILIIMSEGWIVVTATTEEKAGVWDPSYPAWRPSYCDGFVYLRIEIKSSLRQTDMLKLFQRLSHTERRSGHGSTKFGLSICKKLVQLMNGHVWVENTGIDMGSTITFIVRLQLSSSQLREIALEESINRENLKGLKVLLVGENTVNRAVTLRLLEKLGCQTIVVDSIYQCLTILPQHDAINPFNLLMVDVDKPDMGVYEIALQAHGKYPLESRPLVVALTSNTDKTIQEQFVKAGMDGIILKPVILAEICNKMCKILQKAHLFQYHAIR